jgi:hypothetical protein
MIRLYLIDDLEEVEMLIGEHKGDEYFDIYPGLFASGTRIEIRPEPDEPKAKKHDKKEEVKYV